MNLELNVKIWLGARLLQMKERSVKKNVHVFHRLKHLFAGLATKTNTVKHTHT